MISIFEALGVAFVILMTCIGVSLVSGVFIYGLKHLRQPQTGLLVLKHDAEAEFREFMERQFNKDKE